MKIFHQQKKMDQQVARLDRIEAKLDQLTEMMLDLARLDERADAFEQKLQRHELRLDLIENTTNKNSETLAGLSGKGMMVERAGWILFAAAVAYAQHAI